MSKPSLAVLFLIFSLLIFSSISTAQLGEVAGQPHFNVSIGSHSSITITVVSQAAAPLPVKVILPTLSSKDANAITPTVTASPMEGFIPPGGDLHINVTVYMPGGTNKAGYTWTGVMQVVTAPNASSGSGGGAVIIEGVAKLVTITATEHISSIWDYLILIIIVAIIIAAIALGVFFARKRGMLGGRKAAHSVKSKGKKSKRATRPKKRTTKRKGKGKGRSNSRKKTNKGRRRT